LDEVSVAQQYYIATRSSPADDHTRVLKYGNMFAVFDHYGDVEPIGLGEQGLFFQGTRHLSKLVACLWKQRPLLLSSSIKADNFLFSADLGNVDVSDGDDVAVSRGTVHVLRTKFLWRGSCYEEFRISSFALSPLVIPVSIHFDADFADIFEVRGMHREQRGRLLPAEAGDDCLVLAYKGLDGILRQTRVHSDPPPDRVLDSSFEFELPLEPRQESVFRLRVSCSRADHSPSLGYSAALDAAGRELHSAIAANAGISSSNARFNQWIKRSIADVEMMTIGNPQADYPYAGVPWFSTVFGRDGIITALEMLWLNPRLARGVLKFLAETQATEVNPEQEAEPGKILHELRSGEMANQGEIPFGRYYGTVDATPLFVMLAGAYYERSGDLELIRRLWPNIQLALQWIERYGDLDQDGFVEYSKHSHKGLVQQGWKDSNDSVFHSDGSLAEAPIALCEVQGYAYQAKLAAAKLARVLGDSCSGTLESEAAELRARFDQAFWCPDLETYALALDGSKRPCRVRASNAGHCLFTGIAATDKAHSVAQTLLGPQMFTGWGVRTVGSGEARYNPLSYHNGSIWPHDNAIIAAGLARYGFKDMAGQVLLGLLDVSSFVDLHRLPELFCGLERRSGEGPTLYPVACSPQSWAAAAVFMVLQACLGISIDGPSRQVSFTDPYLPEGIPQLSIKGLQVNGAHVDLFMERRGTSVQIQVLEQHADLEVLIK
jgi:glycogen debranching enzyme